MPIDITSIKPCGWCGSSDIRLLEHRGTDVMTNKVVFQTYEITCLSCKSQGISEHVDKAISIWNAAKRNRE